MKKKPYEVVDYEGLPCPRCGVLSETRKHKEITSKQRNQPFYYSVWFNCINTNCRTTIFMSEDYKVVNKNGAARALENYKRDREEYDQQLSFLKDIS